MKLVAELLSLYLIQELKKAWGNDFFTWKCGHPGDAAPPEPEGSGAVTSVVSRSSRCWKNFSLLVEKTQFCPGFDAFTPCFREGVQIH